MIIKSGFYQNPSWFQMNNKIVIENEVTVVSDFDFKMTDLTVTLTKSGAAFNLLLAGQSPIKKTLTLKILHQAPKTKSVIMSSVLIAKALFFLKANIILKKSAPSSETHTELRALDLDQSTVRQEPKLIIKSVPKVATHAATISNFDDGQFQYLLARGLTKTRARDLLTVAFLDATREKFFTLMNSTPRQADGVSGRVRTEQCRLRRQYY